MAYLEKMRKIAISRGADSLSQAKKHIFLKSSDNGAVSQALQHFTNVTLSFGLPIFPALTSLSCEAAGGNVKATTGIAAAIIMIAGAADIHDDIIDQSKSKGANFTVYGKFGKEIAILTGDSLLVYGMRQLEKECNILSSPEKDTVLNLVSDAYSEICAAESLEIQLKSNVSLNPKELFNVIKLKASISELNMAIGAIIAHADESTVKRLSAFGRNLGVLSTVAEEYADLIAFRELQNRLRHECPPLPFLYAMANSSVKQKILPLISNCQLRRNDFEHVTNIVLSAKVVKRLRGEMRVLAQKERDYLEFIQNEKVREELMVFPLTALAFIQELCP